MDNPLNDSSSLTLPDDHAFLAGIDESASYEVDITETWRAPDGKFVLATASGCSCWEGDFQTESFETLDELAAQLVGTERDYGNPSLDNSAALVAAARAAIGATS